MGGVVNFEAGIGGPGGGEGLARGLAARGARRLRRARRRRPAGAAPPPPAPPAPARVAPAPPRLRLAWPGPGRLVVDLRFAEDAEQGRPGNRIDLGMVGGVSGPLAIDLADRRGARDGRRRVRAMLFGRTLVLRRPGERPVV